MGTVAKACLQGSDLLVQQHFRWVQLRWDGEPMQSLLPRFLRRRAVNKVATRSCGLVLGAGLWCPETWAQLCHLFTNCEALGRGNFWIFKG